MRDYFCGWYFKCQSNTQSLAVIPAVHRSKGGQSCSVQLITDDGVWNVSYPYDCFHRQKRDFQVMVAGNFFGRQGVRIQLHTPSLHAAGFVRFGAFSPIRYDIMGPFRFVPFMECRHSVFSMKHTVTGEFMINETRYCFDDAIGYIEGDRGYSFPKHYAWTQCCFEGGSLMLSVAEIPLGPVHFTGIIGVILWHGKEYRIATYLGARAVRLEAGEIVVRQADMVFSAKLIEKRAHPLYAPESGAMVRTIHESAACRASYCFQKNEHSLFSFETPRASFEYEYPL